MLRKTPHQRASMKRNPVYESVTSPSIHQSYRNNQDSYDSNVVYKSNSRKDSPEWSPNEIIRMSEKYARENERYINNDNITAEIAPGIVIKGHVAEL